jgi:hypothetical protein
MLWITANAEREGMKRFLTDYDGVDRAVVIVEEKTTTTTSSHSS